MPGPNRSSTDDLASPPRDARARFLRRIVWALGIVLVCVAGAAAVLARRDRESPTPQPVSPPPIRTARPGDESASFLQIMIAYQRPGGVDTVRRTKPEALELARSLIERVRRGEAMEALLGEYTDDRDPEGKPFNRGSYTIARSSPTKAAIKQAVFATRIGELVPEPVDSGYAFHVIQREE